MRITLLTSLFPPDIGAPAPYVKELAYRLSHESVALLLYGNLPESVPDIEYYCIDKRTILPIRLFQFTKTLYSLRKETDVLLVQNGPSTELPALIVSYLCNTSMVLCISDVRADHASRNRRLYGMIHRLLRKRVHQTISIIDTQPPTDKKISAPLDAPEILPFAESDNDSTTYEESWTKHLDALMKIFHHVTK